MKKKLIPIVGAIILFAIIVAIIILFGKGTHYTDDAITVLYDKNQHVNISNEMYLSDEVGMKISVDSYRDGVLGYLDFEVSSNVDGRVDYEVLITKDDLENEIPVKFLKVYLTDDHDIGMSKLISSRVLTYYDYKISDKNPASKVVYSGTLDGRSKQNFRLRAWVADTYEITTDEKNFSFKVDVRVK